MNCQIAKLLKTILFMVDESMSGCKPKTSNLGGLPNYTYKPRKPALLGTMFPKGLECISAILVYQDVIQNPEQQSQKSFNGERSSLPGNSLFTAHTGQVMFQVDGGKIPEGR
jgi:hypothetical protein